VQQPLKLLIVEDNTADAELALLRLRKAGFEPDWRRVDTEAAFLANLEWSPDLVLSDFHLPEFNGLRALEILKRSGRDIPFILVSGTIGEDTAVVAMKNGASDYLMKDRLERLGPSVTHALAEGRLRSERRQSEAAAQRQLAELRVLFDMMPVMIWFKDTENRILRVNQRVAETAGMSVADIEGKASSEIGFVA
jgi:DNA-binding NtrC family response regulator